MEAVLPRDIDALESLELKHAKMRARDRNRIDDGNATTQEIQDENAMFKFSTFRILNFT